MEFFWPDLIALNDRSNAVFVSLQIKQHQEIRGCLSIFGIEILRREQFRFCTFEVTGQQQRITQIVPYPGIYRECTSSLFQVIQAFGQTTFFTSEKT